MKVKEYKERKSENGKKRRKKDEALQKLKFFPFFF